jgi:nucleoside-diphosphate-sugar epimerase
LAGEGWDITGLDTGFFSEARLYPEPLPVPFLRWEDTRDVKAAGLEGFDSVVHLAELSNDPLGQLDPALTKAINFAGTAGLAEAARASGVRRFLYFSSCSVYGLGGDAPCTEESGVHPQTEYARAKLAAEASILALSRPGFEPVVFRNATVYGPSARMRFDLVVNNLAGMAHTEGRIAMTSDGTPWRPLIHIDDLCDAAVLALGAPRAAVAGMVFNVGGDETNFRVSEIAGAVGKAWPECEITAGSNGADRRSYRVSFSRLRERLGFQPRMPLENGVRELRAVFERTNLTAALFNAPPFTRLRQIQALRTAGRLDAGLRWVGR